MSKRETYRQKAQKALNEITERMHKTGTLQPTTALRVGEGIDGYYVDMWEPGTGSSMLGHTLTGIVADSPRDFYLVVRGLSYGVFHVTGVTHYGCNPK